MSDFKTKMLHRIRFRQLQRLKLGLLDTRIFGILTVYAWPRMTVSLHEEAVHRNTE